MRLRDREAFTPSPAPSGCLTLASFASAPSNTLLPRRDRPGHLRCRRSLLTRTARLLVWQEREAWRPVTSTHITTGCHMPSVGGASCSRGAMLSPALKRDEA